MKPLHLLALLNATPLFACDLPKGAEKILAQKLSDKDFDKIEVSLSPAAIAKLTQPPKEAPDAEYCTARYQAYPSKGGAPLLMVIIGVVLFDHDGHFVRIANEKEITWMEPPPNSKKQ